MEEMGTGAIAYLFGIELVGGARVHLGGEGSL